MASLAATVAAFAIDPARLCRSAAAAGDHRLPPALPRSSARWSALGLAVTGLAAGTRRDAPAVTLATLGFAGLTLALTDPRVAVVAATAGGLFGVWLTLAPGGDRAGATVGIRELRARRRRRDAGDRGDGLDRSRPEQLAAQPVVFGLAYLAFAVAVAIRFGAIPFHLWAARLTDAVPETALPIVTVLAPASFAIVALAWTDSSIAPLLVDLGAERGVVLAIAIASIVLAALAALVQDDLEHVVGYSIIGDAGVVLLALAALDPAGWAPARTWILAFVVARSAFAAWAGGHPGGVPTGRIVDLRGWVIRSPILAVGVRARRRRQPRPARDWPRSRLATSLVSLALDGPAGDARAARGRSRRSPTTGGCWSSGWAGRTAARARASSGDRVSTRLDLTAPVAWWRATWDVNRGVQRPRSVARRCSACSALATSAGAFGGPEAAAAAWPPGGAVRSTTVAPSRSRPPTPSASRSGRAVVPARCRSRARPSRACHGAVRVYSVGASTQRSTSRS